jgi:GTP diphosphokinase / guanosine-3',5'-bis(diphosphate) 3'-diphosphatase
MNRNDSRPVLKTSGTGDSLAEFNYAAEKIMPTLERAIEIAAKAHSGQVDKGGQPYILHPLRLMLSVRSLHERMAAVLHDVVEDTDLTLSDLAMEGFPAEVVSAIQALTKLPGESRIEAAHRAAAHPVARVVKLADVTDNMDISRIAEPTEKDFARLKEYEQVRLVLLAAT